MPIYEYECPLCGKVLEVHHQAGGHLDPPLTCLAGHQPATMFRRFAVPRININRSRYGDEIEDFKFKHLDDKERP